MNDFFSLDHYAHSALFEGVQFPWEALERLNEYLKRSPLGHIECSIPSSVHLVNSSLISIGKGTVVEPGVYIQGPCIIGPECVIRYGAYLRGEIVTGRGCVLGHDTEIKHSILLDGVCAAHFNYVGDSILGNKVNLGAGVKCANLRLDHRRISVDFEGKKRDTGMNKLGAIIGDEVQIGCNSVTSPGTLIGRESLIYPCICVGGVILPHARVKSAQKNIIKK